MGKTPLLVHRGRWPKVSAIGGITARGRLHPKVRKGSIRGPQVIAFLHHLQRHIRRRPIMILWDDGPNYRSKLVKAYPRDHPRLEVHRYPGYCPELYPVGGCGPT